MVIKHKIEVQTFEDELSCNYEDLLGESWCKVEDIKTLLKSDYMTHLMHYINQRRLKDTCTYPKERRDMFAAFREIEFDKVKVVIFNDFPNDGHTANGIGFGEYKKPTAYNSMLKTVEGLINQMPISERNEEFDYTLSSWCEQGVLMLNTSLFVDWNKQIHKEMTLMFKNFIRNIVKAISDNNTNVLFVFTSDEQIDNFYKYIDQSYHYVLECTDGFIAGSDILEQINDTIFNELGENPIKW